MNGRNATTLTDNKTFVDLLIFISIIQKNVRIYKKMVVGINVQNT